MRAEIAISVRRGDPVEALSRVYGPTDAAALAASAFAAKSPSSAGAMQYASHQPDFILMAWSTPGQIVLYVESDGGRLRRVAAQAWAGARQALRDFKPTLQSLVLLDEDKSDEIATASIGLGANLRRGEFVAAVATGLATAIVLVLGGTKAISGLTVSSDLVIGSIPALAAAIIALIVLVVAVHRKALVWE